VARSTGEPARRAILIALAVAAAACDRAAPLPPTLVAEDVVADLGAAVADVPRAVLDPGDPLRGDGERTSLALAPGARTTLDVAVPPDAALRFGVGVAGDGERDRGRSGVRFTLAVDGRERFARTVNPAADRHDRRWFDERVDLADAAGRTVRVTLGVDADAPGRPLAGEAGWSRLRLVRSTIVPRVAARASEPNLLVLLVDTLRADAVGLYGGGTTTPALDTLGRRGTVFEAAVSQAPWTLPSVATLMTGLPPRRHGAIGDPSPADRPTNGRWGFLTDEVTTWAELAAGRGITTIGVSANPLVSRGTNVAQGFETFVELPWDAAARTWASADRVNEAFLAWLPRVHGYRFAAYLHYMEPHDPYTPSLPPPTPAGMRPAIAAGWVRDAANRINWRGTDPLAPHELAHLRARYAGEVRTWDRALARLLDGLAAAGVADDTIVVVTADHGEEFQEHGRLTHGSHLYEESIRVPLVFAGPGIPVDRRADVAQGIDLFPTLLGLVGAVPPRSPGRDLLAAERTPRPAVVETASGIAPDGHTVDVVAVRTAGWKLVETPALGRTEVYDLAADPREEHDRADTAVERVALAATLERWRAETPPARGGGPADPAFAQRLRALGYVP
jgi:arylsulfatase A-like enzyme